MSMLEAKCGLCGETFIPVDENDLMHMEKEDGTACEGTGDLVAEYKTMRGTAKKRVPSRRKATITSSQRLKVFTPAAYRKFSQRPTVETAANVVLEHEDGAYAEYYVYYDKRNRTHRMFVESSEDKSLSWTPESIKEILPANASTWTLAGAVMHIAQLLQEASKY